MLHFLTKAYTYICWVVSQDSSRSVVKLLSSNIIAGIVLAVPRCMHTLGASAVAQPH